MDPRSVPTRILLATALLAGGAQAQTIYVNADLATGANDGSSWANAFQGSNGLQAALGIATPGRQVFVTQGTYYPTQTTSREESFILQPGVEIYGGFFGNEATPEDRFPFDVFPSVLSGDLLQDDLSGNISDNSRHVVRTVLANTETLLDRFHITRGNADGDSGLLNRGGGLLCIESPITIRDCFFSQNWSSLGGPALAIEGVGPLLDGCVFTGNTGSAFGGAALLVGAVDTRIDRCSFAGNDADRGGALMSFDSTGTEITSSYFVDNSALGGLGGGAVYVTGPGTMDIVNCTVAENAARFGVTAGIAVPDPVSDVQVANTILWNNVGAGGSQGSANQVSANANVTYSIVQGGSIGIGNLDSDPQLLPGSPFLTLLSPAIDAGNTAALPAGQVLDILDGVRLIDQPSIPDSGTGGGLIVDIGAKEYQQFSGMLDSTCISLPNSTGTPSILTGGGLSTITNNSLVLAVGNLPTQQMGLLVMSQTTDSVPVSNGILCLGGDIIRFADNVVNTGSNGGVLFPLDFQDLPQGQVFQAGETWYFQLWHRDQGGTSNFSNSLGFIWN